MKNPFKAIETDDKLPPGVKEQTLSNLYTLRLVLDLVDLFAVKAGETFTQAAGGTVPPDPKPKV